jgi:hypothetical protein
MQIESTNIGTYRVCFIKLTPASLPASTEQSNKSSPLAALLKQKLNANENIQFPAHGRTRTCNTQRRYSCPGSQIATVDDPFLRKGGQLMIDGSEQEYIKEVPDSDISQA